MPVLPTPDMATQTRKIINGNPNGIFQTYDITYSPRTGGQTKQTWKGPLSALVPKLNQLKNLGWEYHLYSTNNGANYTLDATIGDIYSTGGILQATVADVWELTSSKVEVSFLKCPSPLTSQLDAADVRIFNAYFLNPPNPAIRPDQFTDPTTTPPGNLSYYGLTAMALVLSGVTTAIIFQPHLKRTQTVLSATAAAASIANIGKVYTTAALRQLIPNTVNITIPDDPVYSLPSFQYGWLQDSVNQVASAFNKTQVIMEWEFGYFNPSMTGAFIQPNP